MATIVSLRAVLLSHEYPASPRLEWVGGHIDTWDAALLEMTLSDGTTGLGEVAQGIMGALAVPGIVEAMMPYALGLEADHPPTVTRAIRDRTVFWARGGICSGVLAAVEQCLWDIAGKRAGRPAYELMATRSDSVEDIPGAIPEDVEVYASGGLGTTTEQVLEWAHEQEQAGYGTVKFRAMQTPQRTIELIEEIVPQLAPNTRFVIDAVQGCASRAWSVDDAVAVGRVAATFDARWYEEPCRAEDVGGYSHVRERVDVPVSGVESYTSPGEFARLLEHDGVDIVQPDAAMVGGPSEFQRVAALAAERGVATVPHIWGTGVTLMANLHTALATAGVDLVELCTIPNPLREALLVEPLRRDGSKIHRPTAAGLGVRLTPEIEQQYPFRPGRGHVIS
jgi:L-alanine-DL-glutamate epimerase-like enolase superfamily enzyme